jgi:hypothetical protein
VAQTLISGFSLVDSMPLETAVSRALRSFGFGPVAADVLAAELLPSVHRRLQSTDARALPFDIKDGRPSWLIGKGRPRQGEPKVAVRLRRRLELVPALQNAVYELGDDNFERACAELMLLSGASDAHAIGGSDEGGIDVYGRLPIWVPDVPEGLLKTHLGGKQLLFLAQCKGFDPKGQGVGREQIQKLGQQVKDCLDKYRRWERPPSNAVPTSYYEDGETCIKLFFTSAAFSRGARDAAQASDVITIDGIEIAHLLLYHGIGIRESGTDARLDPDRLADWAAAKSARPAVRSPGSE